MAYFTGTAADANDFLGQVVAWLATEGWTVNMLPTVNGNAGGKRAHVSKGGMFVNLQSMLGDTNLLPDYAFLSVYGLLLYLSTGFDAGQGYLTQPGGPMDAAPERAAVLIPTAGFAAPYGRIFGFSDAADNVVFILERKALNFSHFGWGPSLVKAGAWTGGAYFFGEYYRVQVATDDGSTNVGADCPFALHDQAAGYVRADVDAFSGWLACTTSTGTRTGATGKKCSSGFGRTSLPTDVPLWNEGSGYKRLAASQFNGQAVLVPVDIYAERDAGGSSLLGSVPNIFLCNAVGHGFGPATVFSIGADDYLLFPSGTPDRVNDPGYGYAIKKL